MKRQICFAGFNEEEIALLRPELAALSHLWSRVFPPDAFATLQALEASPIDALLVNLSPVGINDPAFLHDVAMRYPRTLLFVLGSVEDRALTVTATGAAHQFISRPWKPQELISIIMRSMALDPWLSNDRMRAFVPRLGKLPGLSSTYFEVLKKAESSSASVESIAEVIARDPTLTARLLQMVNSAACGLPERITNPAEAVSILGLDAIKSLVLCLQLFYQTNPTAPPSLSFEQLWDQSLRVARYASKIVLRCINSERMASEAYTAGLLHNIGQIVLATNFSTNYTAVIEAARQRQCLLHKAESEIMGVTSPQVGAYLLGVWGMPLGLVEAAALHHAPASPSMADFSVMIDSAPTSSSSVEFSVLTAVHVAFILALEDNPPGQGLILPALDADYLAALELPNQTSDWRGFLEGEAPKVARKKSQAYAQAARKTVDIDAPVLPQFPQQEEHEKEEAEGARPGRNYLVMVATIAVLLLAAMAYYLSTAGPHNIAPRADKPSSVAQAPPPGASTPSLAALAPLPAKSTPPPAAPTPVHVVTIMPAAPLAQPQIEMTNLPSAESVFNSIKIQGVTYNADHQVVIINGKVLEVGDFINNVKVTSIQRSRVVLDFNGTKKTFKLN